MNKDKFGNAVPFVAVAKDATVPANEIGKGPLLTKTVDGVELTLQLDILHVQRGECKGQRYFGLVVTNDTLPKVEEFYGSNYIASRIDTALNTENQRYCLGQGGAKEVKPIAEEKELLKALAERSSRSGESISALREMQQDVSMKMIAAMKSGDVKAAKQYQDELLEVVMKLATK